MKEEEEKEVMESIERLEEAFRKGFEQIHKGLDGITKELEEAREDVLRCAVDH